MWLQQPQRFDPASARELKSISVIVQPIMLEFAILRNLSVLLLEDDALVNMSTTAMLEEFGCLVQPVFDLTQAFAAVAHWTPDFSLLDVNIGGEKSFGFASTLTARRVPIAFLTGYDSSILKGAGIDRPYCQKPCKPEDLGRAIAAALTQRQP